jgi:VWFA-related protein
VSDPAPPILSSTSVAPASTSAVDADDGRDSRLVLVVDVASLRPELVARARESILTWVRRDHEPGTRLMLVTVDQGLQIPVAFTDDVERFAAAVAALRSRASAADTLEAFVSEVGRACELPYGRPAALGLARGWVEQARQTLDLSMQGLAALARYLATVPGRKQVVLFSAGYSTEPGAVAAAIVSRACGGAEGSVGREVEAGRLLRLVADEANRARVSFYAVDVRGLESDLPPASVRVSGGGPAIQNLQSVIRQVQREGRDSLHSIADETGATAFLNTNDPGRALRAAAVDARSYYLLGYAPPSGRKEGHFYRVDVRVRRPGVSLRHRRGYEWLSERTRTERAIAAAFLFPALCAGDGLTLDATLTEGRVDIRALIPTSALIFRSEDGKFCNEITIQAVLRDEKGRLVGRTYLFSKTVSLRLPPDRYADLRDRDTVEVASEAVLPGKGRFRLWVAAHHSGGRLAVADIPLEAR